MAFNRNLLATAAAIVLLVLSAPSDQAGAVPPETGVWSVGASAGFRSKALEKNWAALAASPFIR